MPNTSCACRNLGGRAASRYEYDNKIVQEKWSEISEEFFNASTEEFHMMKRAGRVKRASLWIPFFFNLVDQPYSTS